MIPVDILYIPTWCRISFIQSMDGQLKKNATTVDIKIYTPYMKNNKKEIVTWRVTTWQFFVTLRYGGNLWSSPHPLSSHTSINGCLVVHVDGSLYSLYEKGH